MLFTPRVWLSFVGDANNIINADIVEKRYELTFDYKGESKKEKAVLIICLNPASRDIMVSDVTTNYILNNLLPMGFTTITICNLCARITNKLKGQDLLDNSDNLDYISTIIRERKYNTILLAYGNGNGSSKNVNEEKRALEEILKNSKCTVSEIVDKAKIRMNRRVTFHKEVKTTRLCNQPE